MTTEVSLEQIYTIEEFMDLPDDGRGYELVRGRLRRMSPTGGEHGQITSIIHIYLGSYIWEHDLGDVFAAETAFVLNPATRDVRGADVGFVARARLDEVGAGAVPFPPDLAVEVISPSDILREVREKVADYQRAGVPLVWVVNPRRQTVAVYHPADTEPTTLGLDDTLDGEAVVPGFTLAVRTVFARRRSAPNR